MSDLGKTIGKGPQQVTQIPAEKFMVLINKLERDNIGVGGKLLSEIL